MKLGGKDVGYGTKDLTKLRNNIDTKKMGPPSFLMVLTGGQYAVKIPDGVYVALIGCLRD